MKYVAIIAAISLSGCVSANETPQQTAQRIAIANALGSMGQAVSANAARPVYTPPQQQRSYVIPAPARQRCVSQWQNGQLVSNCTNY